MPATTSQPPSGPAEHFALIIDGLCRAMALQMRRKPLTVPLLLLMWGRLRRTVARFASLTARIALARQAGSLPLVPRRRITPPRPPDPQTQPEAAPPRKPTRNGSPKTYAWLVRLVPEAACFGTQLQHLLSQPEMAALIEAAPQMGRILRPLCQALATPLSPALQPPPLRRPPTTAQADPEQPTSRAAPNRPPKPRRRAEPRRQETPRRLSRALVARLSLPWPA